ncbi:hypothetical protein C0992_006251 [Termitomyces sp. T32_za158]|nr:hypothetical protein C0992_006251 [Termitomyces sp. T32_za158]
MSESEAPKCVCRCLFLVSPTFEGGPLGSNVFLPGSGHLLPSITVCQGVPEILQAEVCRLWEEIKSLREEVQVVRQECNKVARARDTLLCDRHASLELWEAQVEEIEQLWAQLTWEAAGSLSEAPEFAALSVHKVKELARGLHQVTESESCWQEWLLREVARMRLEVLG